MNTIPIRYDGYLHLDVKVEDKVNGNFVFDTGASGMILDSLFCKNNGLDFKTEDIVISGIGNSTKMAQLITDTAHYEIGNKGSFSDVSLILNLKSMIGKKIDGISSIQTFAQRPYKIDYVSQKIVFIDSVDGYEALNAQFEDNKIYLPLSVTLENGKKIQGRFLLDTGSDQTVLNTNAFMTAGIYDTANKKKFFARGGVGGDSNGYFLPVTAVDLGRFKIENFIATISTDSLGSLADSNYMGIIGNDLLDDFHIIFDHQKKEIWVKPNKNFNKNKRELFRSISFFDRTKSWVVAGIVEDTEAYRKGIRMNDEIIEVNNVEVEKIDLDKFVGKLKPNDHIHLKIKRGNEEKEIKFKLNVFLKS